MWEYLVLAGQYRLDGADVVIENQKQGRTTLQAFLDYSGKEGFELVSTHFTPAWAAVIMKRPRGAAPHPAAEAEARAASGAGVIMDDEGQLLRRRKPAAPGGTHRRARADLDRLARDD